MSCRTRPNTMDAVAINPGLHDCNQTVISFAPVNSCEPVSLKELQCKGADGIFTNMNNKTLYGGANELTMNTAELQQEPFMLNLGDSVVCRVRSKNSNGWSHWSMDNPPYALSNCFTRGKGEAVPSRPKCECKRTCKATGCGGCCNHQNGTYWSDLAKKACCKFNRCNGCTPKKEADKQHRHKYCHLHAEDKNKTRKDTRWEIQKVKTQQEVLKPFKKMVKRTVMRKQQVKRQKMGWRMQSQKKMKTVMKKEKKEVTKIEMRKRMWQKPVTKIVTKYRTINKTVNRAKRVTKNVIVQVKRIEKIPELKYVQEHIKRKAVRMVKQMKTVEKTVPKNVPMPVGEIRRQLNPAWDNCGCYQNSCNCYGQSNCDCCFPACQCAPSIISPTETEIIITQEECEVPEPYLETITREVPKLTYVDHIIEEPKLVMKTFYEQVPHIVQVKEAYDVPEISYVPTLEEYPIERKVMEEVEVPVEIEVTVEVKVPQARMVSEYVDMPFEEDTEITEQRSVMEDVFVDMPVAVEFEVKVPSPPCHWHELQHSHDVVGCPSCTTTHTHYHPDN